MVLRNPTIRFAIVAVMVFVLAFSFLGMPSMGMHMGMQMDMHSTMESMDQCSFSGNAPCTMSLQEHIAWSESMLTMIAPLLNATNQFILAIFSFASTFLFFARAYAPQPRVSSGVILRRRRHPLRNALQEAFSNGILNPKTY